MDLSTLRKLVRRGEGQQLEFKYKAKYPEKIIKEIVAFANTDGGTLLVGVSDSKEIKGLKYPDEDEFVLRKAIEEHCFPPITYEVERLLVDHANDREVLIFHIPKSQTPPHYTAQSQDHQDRKVYIRVEDKSIQASKEVREVLKLEQKKPSGIGFQYGDKEQVLMQYLRQHTRITLSKFSEIASIPRKIASRTLIILVVANVLQIIPSDKQDTFEIKQDQHTQPS